MLPASLMCVACDLKLSGHSKLAAVNLGARYTKTSRFEPIEYYAGDYAEGWDDNNE